MKSIVFTKFKEKLLSGEKDQTFRVIYIPKYIITEVVKIDFKEIISEEEVKRETLFQATVMELYPKRIKDVTLEEARRDGFSSVREFKLGIIEIHGWEKVDKARVDLQWGFITRFKRIPSIMDYVEV